MMTPSLLWAGFDAQSENLNSKLLSEENNKKTYAFLAMTATDGEVIAEINVFSPPSPTKKAVLLVGEYYRLPQSDLIENLVSKNYLVCYVDYSAVGKNTNTVFPPSLSYGVIANAGDHLKKLCPTAKDTCQYLYSVIVKRAITFIQKELLQKEIVLVGIKSGVEIAMQTAGSDNRLLALACICGAGYTEYLDKPKYENDEIILNDELMQWLTSVSSVAYAKHIKLPVLITVGSNGKLSDIDRLSNIITLMAESEVRINISPRYLDNISKKSYNNFVKWLEGVFLYSTPPEIPVMTINVNNAGAVYASVRTDSCIEVESVKVYYSYGDNSHSTRYWSSSAGETVGECEFIAKMPVSEPSGPLFAFCEVNYRNGIVLSSIIYHIDLENYKITTEKATNIPIIFQYATHQGNFTEVRDDAVILNDSIEEDVLPINIKGLKCRLGSMVTFFRSKDIADTKLLQIDTYSSKLNYTLSMSVIRGGAVYKEYFCEKNVIVTDSYYSLKLSVNDFKGKDYLPLESWQDIKGIIIKSIDVTIGKIMFI